MASAVKFGPQLLQVLGIYNHPQILSLINSIHLNNNMLLDASFISNFLTKP